MTNRINWLQLFSGQISAIDGADGSTSIFAFTAKQKNPEFFKNMSRILVTLRTENSEQKILNRKF